MSTQINVKIVSLYSLVLTFNSCNTVHCPQKLGERMPFVTKRYKQIPAYAGKVTVGLAIEPERGPGT